MVSLQHWTAAALIYKAAGIAQLADAVLHDPPSPPARAKSRWKRTRRSDAKRPLHASCSRTAACCNRASRIAAAARPTADRQRNHRKNARPSLLVFAAAGQKLVADAGSSSISAAVGASRNRSQPRRTHGADKTALVAGASGLIGRRIADQLLAAGSWKVIGLARRHSAPRHALDRGRSQRPCRCRAKARRHRGHAYFLRGALRPSGRRRARGGRHQRCDARANLVTTLEPAGKLEHVHAVHGSKWLRPPVWSGARAARPKNRQRANNRENFYFMQEDFLRERKPRQDAGATRPRGRTPSAIRRSITAFGRARHRGLRRRAARTRTAARFSRHRQGLPGAHAVHRSRACSRARSRGWRPSRAAQSVVQRRQRR